MTVVTLVLLISFLVIIHELGHLVAAFWAKIKVEEFGLGYPPKAKTLFSWRGVPFTLNWVPFGGFVRMAGEDTAAGEAHKLQNGEFYKASVRERVVVIMAGAAVNFVFGILAFTILFSLLGIPRELTEARIAYVAPGSPAEASGLPSAVTITGIKLEGGFTPITSPKDVISFVAEHRGKEVTIQTTGKCTDLECEEVTQEFTAYIRTVEETPAGEGALGVAFQDYVLQFYSWYEMPFRGAWYGVTQAIMLGYQILIALQTLVVDLVTKGVIPSELTGPVGIVHEAQSVGLLDQGWPAVVSFAGMLSVNLAIMNILPIPPLDGGKALFTVLEPVISRKRLHRVEYWVNYAGYILLMGLIIVITIRDVAKIIL